METKKEDPMMVQRDPNEAKKPWQTPRLTCETDANGAQKLLLVLETSPAFFGPS